MSSLAQLRDINTYRFPATDAVLTVAIATSSTAAAVLPGAAGQRLMVSANTDCYVRFGASGVAAASSTAYTVFVMAGSRFVIEKPNTHVRAIRATADGVLSFTLLA